MQNTFELVDPSTPEGKARIEKHERERAELIKRGQQIYARIKRTSKYYGQGERGALFPVYVEAGWGRGERCGKVGLVGNTGSRT